MFKIDHDKLSEIREHVNNIYITNAGYNREEVEKLNDILDEIEYSDEKKYCHETKG